jgi:hypothetical protein
VKQSKLLSVALAAICILGCGGGSSEPRLPTVKVKGTLYVDDKPFGPCLLTLVPNPLENPDKSKPRPHQATAKVGDSGSFVLTTYEPDDGIPLGKYDVVLATDMANMTMKPVPRIKPIAIEITKADDKLDLKLEGTGEVSSGPADMTKLPGGPPARP